MTDLRARIVNRPQITSDGFLGYPGAIERAFSTEVDYGRIEKAYATVAGNDAAHRYSPGSIRGSEKTVIQGRPDPAHISTSFVERFNLSTRMVNADGAARTARTLTRASSSLGAVVECLRRQHRCRPLRAFRAFYARVVERGTGGRVEAR